MRLFLIRHGQTDWNKAAKLQGHSQIPLNDIGRQQVEAVTEHLEVLAQSENLRWQEIITSDLIRARESGDIIARRLKLEVREDPLWREVNLGDWEGQNRFHLRKQKDEIYQDWCEGKAHVRPPGGGESREQAWQRLQKALDGAVEGFDRHHSDQGKIVVTHGGVGNVILYRLQNSPFHVTNRPPMGNCMVHEVHWHPQDGWKYAQYLEFEKKSG